jgi:hypothetical protein
MFAVTSPIYRVTARRVPRWIVRLACVLVCCLQLVSAGCQVSHPKNLGDSRVHEEKDFSVNSEQMRLRMRAMVQPMSGVIVASADQILAGTTDPVVRREALLWKIEGIPALREALFQPNPKTALLDTWVMTFQMTDYFDKGPGAKALGDAHGIAVTASQSMEAEMSRVANSLTFSGSMAKARDFARTWAADHPIMPSIASRQSTLSLVTEKDLPDVLSSAEAMGSLVVTVDDLNRRLEIYSAQLPDQTRWQAELFAMDQTRQYELEKVLPLVQSAAKSAARASDALDRALPTVEHSLAVLDKTPALMATERENAIKALSGEVTRTITFAQNERIAALKQLTAERITTVQDAGAALVQQQRILTRDMDGIALKAVDHAFLRAVQLCAAVLVVGFFGVILLMLLARRIFQRPVVPR